MKRSFIVAALLLIGTLLVGLCISCVLLLRWMDGPQVAAPPELLRGVSQHRTIYTEGAVYRVIPNVESAHLVVAEVTLESGETERRAYIVLDREEAVYLGPLRAIPADGSVELLFFEVNGSRLAVAWVDPTFTSRLVAVSLVRSEQPGDIPGDDNLSRLSYGPAHGQVAFILLRQYDRWQELIQVRVSAKGSDGYFHVEDFPVPYPLSDEFERHSVTWP